MISVKRRQIIVVLTFGVLFAAFVLPADAVAQVATLSGKITLKQADGTEVPAPGGIASADHTVTVNGTSAISGATVFSDSTVTTAKGSSAVVSLGKLGRVEVMPDTTMKLSFTDSTIAAAMLDAGRVRVSSSSGVNASTTTTDGVVVGNGVRQNDFIVDTTCGNTFVAVVKGGVELRAGSTVKQIAAGNQDTAGTSRPGCTPSARPHGKAGSH
ncbi:MAG TPA: hypothetical protein VJU86_21625 [Pyrinomonadaceae bacterium]|nr:hypothetical protein [Pyrinomonadaceae bacterium]